MDDPMQVDADASIEFPHELADLTLAIAVRLHLGGHKPTWDTLPPPPAPAVAEHDDLMHDPDADASMPDELDILESYLMVVNDLSVTQAVAVLAHPDYDIVEYCMDGQIEQVRLHLTYAQQGRLHVSDSVLGECIDEASANGDIELLELLTGAFPGRKLYYSVQAMDRASAGGHIDCLEWWLAGKDRFKLRYSAAAMDSATEAGLIDVLEWWLESGLELTYSSDGLKEAFRLGELASIKWWWTNRAQLDYDFEAQVSSLLVSASEGNQIAVLQWWTDLYIPFPFWDTFLARAANEGHVETLDFWYQFLVNEDPETLKEVIMCKDGPLRFSDVPQIRVLDWLDSKGIPFDTSQLWMPVNACAQGRLDLLKWLHGKGLFIGDASPEWVDHASRSGHLDVLIWIVSTRSEPTYSANALDLASDYGRLDVVHWWFDSGLELQCTSAALDRASQNGHLEVLKLWKASGHPLKYSEEAVDHASMYGCIDVLEWWLTEAQVPLKYSEAAIDGASQEGRVDVLAWWLNQSKTQGLALKFSLPTALKTPSVACLDWWRASGLIPLDYESHTAPQLGDPEHLVDWWMTSGIAIKPSLEPKRLDFMYTPRVGTLEHWEQLGLPIRLQSVEHRIDLLSKTSFPRLEWAVGKGHLPVKAEWLGFEPEDEVAHVHDWLVDHASGARD